MYNRTKIKKYIEQTITKEINAIKYIKKNIDDKLVSVVELIYKNNSNVVISGIGKSAIIAKKIVATLNSTGTTSVFMHAADAIHGDLGMVKKNDIVIIISNSGNTPEIKLLSTLIKTSKNYLVAFTGNKKSFLAKKSDFVINSFVEEEACPFNLAPTCSTTAQLVIGDAMAIALLELKQFTKEDFAKYHPGGNLGKKLSLKVSDIYIYNEKPQVRDSDEISKVLIEISSKRLGATAVMDNENKLTGIITDGDIRRMLETKNNFSSFQAQDIMNQKPKTISEHMLASDAFSIMKKNNITQLIIVNSAHIYIGMIHLHDILKEGIN